MRQIKHLKQVLSCLFFTLYLTIGVIFSEQKVGSFCVKSSSNVNVLILAAHKPVNKNSISYYF